jgi:tetratricopeptide (TPR) repeat protein
MTRDFAAANNALDRGLKINPKSFGLWEIKSKVAIEDKGDFSVAESALALLDAAASTPDIRTQLSIGRVNLALLQRKFEEAAREANNVPDDVIARLPGALCSKYSLIGTARKVVNDEAGARQAFLKAKAFAQERIKQDPNNAGAHSQLAEALAWLGEKDSAIAESKRASELLPESKDAFEGPAITESLAIVYTIVGEKAQAIEILSGLLARPSSVTVQTLKMNPVWDPLRDDPRFQSLLDKYAVKT